MGIDDFSWRETLYRQMAHQPGLPPALRPELIKRAEGCLFRRETMPAYDATPGRSQGCKGAIGR